MGACPGWWLEVSLRSVEEIQTFGACLGIQSVLMGGWRRRGEEEEEEEEGGGR